MNPLSFNTVSSASTANTAPVRHDLVARRPDGARPLPQRQGDQVELSSNVRLSTDESDRPVRLDLVSRIREQLKSGTYETPDKVAIAADLASRDLDVIG